MNIFSVPFAYEMYGRIEVVAQNKEEAMKLATTKLEEMTTTQLHEVSNYLEDSLEIDEEGQILEDSVRSASNIVWDYEEGEEESYTELPGSVVIPDNIANEDVADYLSDTYGWCVVSFDLE